MSATINPDVGLSHGEVIAHFAFWALSVAALFLLRALVVWLAWGWFVVPWLGLPAVTFGRALVLLLILAAARRANATPEGAANKVSSRHHSMAVLADWLVAIASLVVLAVLHGFGVGA